VLPYSSQHWNCGAGPCHNRRIKFIKGLRWVFYCSFSPITHFVPLLSLVDEFDSRTSKRGRANPYVLTAQRLDGDEHLECGYISPPEVHSLFHLRLAVPTFVSHRPTFFSWVSYIVSFPRACSSAQAGQQTRPGRGGVAQELTSRVADHENQCPSILGDFALSDPGNSQCLAAT
jgi:hypothetical protein